MDYQLGRALRRLIQQIEKNPEKMDTGATPSLLYEPHRFLDEEDLQMGTWIALNCWSGHSRAALDLRWEMRGIWPVLFLHHIRFYVAPVYPLFYRDASRIAHYFKGKELSLVQDPARALRKIYREIYEDHKLAEIPVYRLFSLQVYGG